ncbi:MAG TPA: hypothetical protein VH520_12405 [Streptosporangiaceae bacterium]
MSQQLVRQGDDRAADSARPRPGASRVAWTLLGLSVVLMAASLVIAVTGGETWDAKLAVIPVELALAVVGVLVAARSGNRLGWLFLATGTEGAAAIFAGAYAGRVPSAELPGAPWLGWIFPVLVGLGNPLLYLIALLFPDGRLPSRRWRPLLWLTITAGVVEGGTAALSNVDFTYNFPLLRDPVTVVAPLTAAYNLSQLAGMLVLLAGAASVIVRFRRAGQEERLQLKWFVYATAVSAVAITASSTLMSNPLPVFDSVFPLIPAAVGIAILKYRLYDIDRLISRTLAYAILTGLLVGVYAGLVLLATEVFRFHTPVAVAAATLAAAALFNPVRRRVQRAADRRFNRVRYDADQTVTAFAGTLRDAVDPDTVRADLLAVVSKAVEPAHVSLWVDAGRQRA